GPRQSSFSLVRGPFCFPDHPSDSPLDESARLVFLPLANVIGQGETFWIFAVVVAFTLWFVGRYVPETRDREFNEVDTALQSRFGRNPQAGPASS
ncbi:MFS transporter, partial [Streptomyces sp. NPDC050421]|uniref:MFS transporter n=1 Tax=Streptomyces sp. NPDC050421 TaxID=3365613 RepID=UPI0037B1D57C